MKILITIPHYYRQVEGGNYGSLRENTRTRAGALQQVLMALRRLDERFVYRINMRDRSARRIVSDDSHKIDIVVCTTLGCHLMDSLTLPDDWYEHRETDAKPMELGFECHRVIRERLDDYDWFGFMEDDLIIDDPWFFRKLVWFHGGAGDESVLMPNRNELIVRQEMSKVYIDGKLIRSLTEAYQNLEEKPGLQAEAMGGRVYFGRPTNPHAGCFFISQSQAQRWINDPCFLDGDHGFIGPLESAATLGIMKTFRIYKPVEPTESFLEIRHSGSAFAGLSNPESVEE